LKSAPKRTSIRREKSLAGKRQGSPAWFGKGRRRSRGEMPYPKRGAIKGGIEKNLRKFKEPIEKKRLGGSSPL